MRFLRGILAAASVALLIGIFGYFSAVPDDLAAIHPFVVSQSADFYRSSESGRNHFVISRTVELKNATISRIHTLLPKPKGVSIGFSYKFVGSPSPVPMQDAPLVGLTYWRQLRWNEILWIRLTHLRHDPFKQGLVARMD